ncbi:MAG: hypothetical protein QOI53_3151, partial [Verrucomicrobiota bacterium]|nr:hypothetical protein [Verrucomicrobiota bacterium]
LGALGVTPSASFRVVRGLTFGGFLLRVFASWREIGFLRGLTSAVSSFVFIGGGRGFERVFWVLTLR